MSQIQINNLYPVGSELFTDTETFLNELSDTEVARINGGLFVSQVSVTAGYVGKQRKEDNNKNNPDLSANLSLEEMLEPAITEMNFSLKTYFA